jgi:hypothetical protein
VQGLLVVFIMGMYVSSAPLVSQMHASAQHVADDGTAQNRHAVPHHAHPPPPNPKRALFPPLPPLYSSRDSDPRFGPRPTRKAAAVSKIEGPNFEGKSMAPAVGSRPPPAPAPAPNEVFPHPKRRLSAPSRRRVAARCEYGARITSSSFLASRMAMSTPPLSPCGAKGSLPPLLSPPRTVWQ